MIEILKTPGETKWFTRDRFGLSRDSGSSVKRQTSTCRDQHVEV